jgi:hypothetical protein
MDRDPEPDRHQISRIAQGPGTTCS